jgi:mRNA interferase RelE/StbE
VRYKVDLETRARREYHALPSEAQKRITEAIDDLQTNPRPPAARRLTAKEGYRIRKGDDRILYTIDDDSRTIRIYRVGHRREVYRRL